jgi:tripartite-type tricarboxylate transporter receptor subunit TctC
MAACWAAWTDIPHHDHPRISEFGMPRESSNKLSICLEKRMRKLILVAMLASGLTAGSAHGQTYPARTVTVVVPIAAGGAVDTTARIFAEQLQAKLGQPFVVENRTGAGATIGTAYVTQAAPDGYTLLLMESSAPLAKWLYKNPPFDVLKDFTPVARIVSNPLVLFANPSLPAKDLKELIIYAKDNPGKVSAGVSGMSHQLAAAMLNAATGITITAIPYRGTAPAVNDILSGTIPLLWSTPVGLMQFVEHGKLKALAVSTPSRVKLLPEVPTVAEAAAPGFQIEAWLGIAGPAGLSDEVTSRLARTIREISAMPELQRRIADTGQNLEYRPSAEFREQLADDQERLGQVIRQAGISPN